MVRKGDMKVAVVGLGEFGQRYLRALETMSGVTITWVSDLDDRRCRETAHRFGIANFAVEMAPLCEDASPGHRFGTGRAVTMTLVTKNGMQGWNAPPFMDGDAEPLQLPRSTNARL